MLSGSRRYRLLVFVISLIAAFAALLYGVPETAGGRRDLSYYFWYPGQSVSAMVTPEMVQAGRLAAYAQLPVAFFVTCCSTPPSGSA